MDINQLAEDVCAVYDALDIVVKRLHDSFKQIIADDPTEPPIHNVHYWSDQLIKLENMDPLFAFFVANRISIYATMEDES